MISRLTGTVIEKDSLHIVIDVGGIGYLVAVRKPAEFTLDAETTLHTHLAVRENALDLYGFLLRDELSMFELLLTVPKIGPKSALQILAQADITLLKGALIKDDAVYLSKMSGISKKTSEKIVAGLKDKFADLDYGSFRESLPESDADLVDALIALGYAQKDARDALMKVASETATTQERLKEALRMLGS